MPQDQGHDPKRCGEKHLLRVPKDSPGHEHNVSTSSGTIERIRGRDARMPSLRKLHMHVMSRIGTLISPRVATVQGKVQFLGGRFRSENLQATQN